MLKLTQFCKSAKLYQRADKNKDFVQKESFDCKQL